MDYPSEDNGFLKEHSKLLCDSYRNLLGKELITQDSSHETIAKTLFYGTFAIVSHNTEIDPVFNYANLKALELFGFNWDEFTRLPSRLSAEPSHQLERKKLLAEVSQQGYTHGCQGIRVTKSGRRFLIKNAVIWNLIDRDGCYAGQAACFADCEFLT
jgi:hypothetical protein